MIQFCVLLSHPIKALMHVSSSPALEGPGRIDA